MSHPLNPMFQRYAKMLMARMEKSEQEGQEPLTAAELNVIRQFLKDNGVEAKAPPGSPLADLASKLPFAGLPSDDDDYASP